MYSRLKRILAGAAAFAVALSMTVIFPYAEESDDYTEIALDSYDKEVSDSSITPTFDSDGVMYIGGDGKHLLYNIGTLENKELEAVRIEYKHDGKGRTHPFTAGYLCDLSSVEKSSANIRAGNKDYSRRLFVKTGTETFSQENHDAVKAGEFRTLTLTGEDFEDLSKANHGNDLWLQITVCDHTYIKSIAVKISEKEPEPEKTPTRIEVSGQSAIDLGSEENFPAVYEYTAQVYDQDDNLMTGQTVTWSSTSNVTDGAVTIGADGRLSVPSSAPEQTLTITAACGSVESEGYTVTIVPEEEFPTQIALRSGVRMRGNGNNTYETYPDLSNEVGMYQAHAVAVLQFNLTRVLASRDYLSKITLNLENSDSNWARPIGVWLYEAPSGDTRTDGKTWRNADWADSAKQSDIRNNIAIVLGSDDYVEKDRDGVAAGRSDYTSSLVTARAESGKYALEFSGDSLSAALDYAQSNGNMLELVLTSASASPASENRSRVYLVDSGNHRGAYLSVDYSTPDSITISGLKSIDLTGIESFPASYKYTASVYDQNGNKMSLTPSWSFQTNASSGKATFDSATGILTIPENAVAQTVTLIAECEGVRESIEILLDRLVPTTIEIVGADSINSYIATHERQISYTARVLDQKGNKMDGQTVSWEFSTDARENAAAFRDGVVTVPVGVADQTLTLTAKCGSVTKTKTVKIEKEVLDLPENFSAEHSMKLRGFGNGDAMKIDPESEEVGMKAAAPGLFRFDLSQIINASDVITGLTFTAYKESGASIALGLWPYADPNDKERTDGKTWTDTDWLNSANKAEVCNNYSLIFGIDDFSARHDTAEKNYAQGRSSYIAPLTTASVSDNKYTFTITGDALATVLQHARENNGIVDLVVNSADLDARGGSVFKMYMSGIAEKNPQYMPTLTVAYDLPSTPRRIEISGNDTLYINNQDSSYTSQYTAAVYDQHGELYAEQEVEWSADLGITENVSFNTETGVLTINSNSGEGVVTITAKSAFAVGTKTVTIKKIPNAFLNGTFEDTDDSYLAAHWTPNVSVYKLNFDETDFYNPWNESNTNNGNTLFTRTQGYAFGEQETGSVRGTSGIDSTVKLAYSTALSDEDAETLMNSGTQAIGINNSKTEGFLKVGYEIPYYYMLDYYLTADSEQVLSNQGVYLSMEFRNKADTGFLASVATGDQIMPFTKGRWGTFTGTFTSGTENQINGQARVNIGIKGMRGTGYIDYFRLIPKGIDTQKPYEGEKSMQVANTLTWTSDIFSVEPESYYTYYASVRPDSSIVDGQVTYTFMDNNYNVKGEYVLSTATKTGWSAADSNGWMSIDGQMMIPAGATICRITLSNPNGQGNVWFDGLVFAKTEEAKANSVRITGGSSEAVIPDSGESLYQYTAVVYDQYNHVMSSAVTWSVANEDGTSCAGVSITPSGILKVIPSATAGNVVITVAEDGKTASKRVAIIQKGAASEPEPTGQYGFNGSFTANDGDAPYGWTNTGRDIVHYTFDSGVESWKSTRTDYGAPVDGEMKWEQGENHSDSASSGSLLLYNPSYNMPGAQIPNDARIQGGMPYKFELYFKQNNITDDSTVRANLRYFNSSGGTIAETPNMLRYYPNEYASNANAAGWQKWSGTEVAPVNASTVRMEMRYRGGLNNSDGYAYFDDVRISKISGLDKENTYNGNPSLMLVGYNEDKTTAGKEYGERWISDRLTNISQGTSYEYSAVMQTYAADSGAYLSFIFYDENGNEISTLKSDKVTGTTNEWKELKGSVIAPLGAVSAAVAYNIDGKGTAWVNGISFALMDDTAISGIKINGAASVSVPGSGTRTENYTVNCVNSSGNSVNAADTVITASNLPSGTSFENGVLTVTSSASAGTVLLSAAYSGYTAQLSVAVTKTTQSGNSGGDSAGGGSGGGGGGSTSGGSKPSGAVSGAPMGNVNYGGEIVSAGQNSGGSTSEVPSLLQAPAVDYFSGGSNSVFEDIGGVPWAKQSIEALYRSGVVKGKAEGQFAPDDPVTRAEFVTMLVKTFKLTAENGENSFADVNEDDWYNAYVNIAVENGIINGISDDYFGAEENITRQDITVMGMRLWNSLQKEMTGKYKASFTDFETVSPYALDAVTAMAEAGIVNGTETGAFAPLDNATRAEAAVIIYRMAVKYDE